MLVSRSRPRPLIRPSPPSYDAHKRAWLAICKAREPDGPGFDVSERLLDDRVHAFAAGRVQDPAVAEPERDVVRTAALAEADEVAGTRIGFVDGVRRGLLLVGVARD